MQRRNKGFTIVELVIVIAVIAILAAILIPVFYNLINRAKETVDFSLVEAMSKALAIEEAESGKKCETMTDALDVIAEAGYNVEKLTPTADNHYICWNADTNRMVYLAADNSEDKTDLWQVCHNNSDVVKFNDEGYNLYLDTGVSGAVVVNHGVDVGENDDITKITYNNGTTPQNVTIRTNSEEIALEINDESTGTIKHYGEAGELSIIQCHTASYHEKGAVKFADIAKGRIVLEKGSTIKHIHIDAKTQTTFDTVIIAKDTAVEMPRLSRDDIEIDETNGTLVVAIQDGTSEDADKGFVWLTKQGIYEQIKISDSSTSAGTVWADDEKNSKDQQDAAQQIANNIGRENGEVSANVTVSEQEYVITFDTTTRELVVTNKDTGEAAASSVIEEVKSNAVEAVADKETVQIGATKFAGGTGTQRDPFMIEDYATFQNVSEFYEEGYKYFKVKDGVSVIDCKNWKMVNLNGSFDGNGVVLNNVDIGLFGDVKGEPSVIKNFTINANVSSSDGVGAVVDYSESLHMTIDSVNVHGTLVGATWVTPYVCFGPGPDYEWFLTIKNCVSDATLVAISGAASGFVGHPYNLVSQGTLTAASLISIEDSAYIGNMTATGKNTTTNNNLKYFTINGNSNRVRTSYTDEFIATLGYDPEGTLYNAPADATGYAVIVNEDGSKTFFAGNSGKNCADRYKVAEKKALLNTTSQATLPASVGSVFTVTKVSGATKAVVSLQIAPNDKNNYGGYLGTYMSEDIDISAIAAGNTFESVEVRYFTINVNSGVTNQSGVSGNIFNVVNARYGKNAINSAAVKIAQFDANGNVLNITSIQVSGYHAAE